MNGIEVGSMNGSFYTKNQFDKELNLSPEEQEALHLVYNALTLINVDLNTIHPERCSDKYLSVTTDSKMDFCRIKIGAKSKWISLSMWRADISLKNDPRFSGIKNRNVRHWKIPLTDVKDISGLFDLIQAAYTSDTSD